MYDLQRFICGAPEEMNGVFFFFLQAHTSLISFNDRQSEKLFLQFGRAIRISDKVHR